MPKSNPFLRTLNAVQQRELRAMAPYVDSVYNPETNLINYDAMIAGLRRDRKGVPISPHEEEFVEQVKSNLQREYWKYKVVDYAKKNPSGRVKPLYFYTRVLYEKDALPIASDKKFGFDDFEKAPDTFTLHIAHRRQIPSFGTYMPPSVGAYNIYGIHTKSIEPIIGQSYVFSDRFNHELPRTAIDGAPIDTKIQKLNDYFVTIDAALAGAKNPPKPAPKPEPKPAQVPDDIHKKDFFDERDRYLQAKMQQQKEDFLRQIEASNLRIRQELAEERISNLKTKLKILEDERRHDEEKKRLIALQTASSQALEQAKRDMAERQRAYEISRAQAIATERALAADKINKLRSDLEAQTQQYAEATREKERMQRESELFRTSVKRRARLRNGGGIGTHFLGMGQPDRQTKSWNLLTRGNRYISPMSHLNPLGRYVRNVNQDTGVPDILLSMIKVSR